MARTRRVKAVSLDPELLDAGEAKAERMHMGFSEYIRSLMRADLGMNGAAEVPMVITGPTEALEQIRHEPPAKPTRTRRVASSKTAPAKPPEQLGSSYMLNADDCPHKYRDRHGRCIGCGTTK